jgi:hypothetical protein
MQLKKTSAFALYIGSYLPLGFILFVQDLDPEALKAGLCRPSNWSIKSFHFPLLHPWWSFGTVGLGIICFLVTLWTLRSVSTPNRIQVVEAKHIPADLINYAMPYIVSFMGIDFASPMKMLGFAVFFLWIFWITYRSGQIIMNPILIVFGWRLFEIKYNFVQSGDQLIGRALSREDIEPNRMYRRGSLQDVMIVDGVE